MINMKNTRWGMPVFTLVFVLVLKIVLILAGCELESGPGSGDSHNFLPAPNVTATKLLRSDGMHYVMISFEHIPEATGYILLYGTSYSGDFIHYEDAYVNRIADIMFFSRITFSDTFPTSSFNSALERFLSPTSAAAFRNASLGFLQLDTDRRGIIAPGTYYYKVYAHGRDGNGNFIRSPYSVVLSVTID